MGAFGVMAGSERPNKMPAGRKPTGINCRNRGRANDDGLGVGKPAEQHSRRDRWVHPTRGVERKANRIADMKNPPRCSPGGAMIQHSNLTCPGSEAVRVSTGRFRFSGRV